MMRRAQSTWDLHEAWWDEAGEHEGMKREQAKIIFYAEGADKALSLLLLLGDRPLAENESAGHGIAMAHQRHRHVAPSTCCCFRGARGSFASSILHFASSFLKKKQNFGAVEIHQVPGTANTAMV